MKKIFAFLLCCVYICAVVCPAGAATFQDVSADDPFYTAVSKLSDIGVIAGRGDGNFDPYGATTRAEFCAFLSRSNGYKDNTVSGKVPFSDVPSAYWAINTIYYCYSNGYVSGMGDGTFEPAREIKYEEAVKMVVVASGIGTDKLLKEGPYWYSGYINRAQEKGLLKGIAVKAGRPIPRAHVAMLIYNALANGYFNQEIFSTPKPTATLKPTSTPTVKPTVTPTVSAKPTGSQKPTATTTATPRPTVTPERPKSKDGKRVVIDAGHNAKNIDTGAIGNGLFEQNITWEIANKLKDHLERNGFEVIMTRPQKTTSLGKSVAESLQKRVDIANRNNADFFISIHCNAGEASGTETYCYQLGGEGEELAKIVQEKVVKATGLTDRGVKTDNLYVIKHTIMPAILLETAFIDNPNDAKLLADEKGQDLFAVAVAQALCKLKKINYLAD